MRVRNDINTARQRLIEQALRRRGLPLRGRERATQLVFAACFLVAATAFALFGEADRELDPLLALAFLGAYALLAGAEFSSGAGYLVPTQVVVVPMLLLLPTPVVPLLVAAATLLTSCAQAALGRLDRARTR